MAAYEVINVSEDQAPDPSGSGDYVNVLDVTFTITGHPGQFTVQVPPGPEPVTAAYNAVMAQVNIVNAIYAGSPGTAEG